MLLRGPIREYIRVLKTAKRPTWDEFKRDFKVINAGILAIGLLGMLITLLFSKVNLR